MYPDWYYTLHSFFRDQLNYAMTDVDIELEHMLLEIKIGRWPQLERFLFSYFCYREGFVTHKGKPDWEAARSRVPHSLDVTSAGGGVLEPVVPLQVVIGEIKRYWRDGQLTPSSLRRILDGLLHYANITKHELTALKQAGLANAMPAGWYQSQNKLPLTRFQQLNIKVNGDASESWPSVFEAQ